MNAIVSRQLFKLCVFKALLVSFFCVSHTTFGFDISESTWNGFDISDYDTQWWGDTETVNWSRYRGYTSNGMISISAGWFGGLKLSGFIDKGYKPIKLTNSVRTTETSTKADTYVPGDHETAEKESKSSSSGDSFDNPFTSKKAHFAKVIDLDDLTLSEGRAIAELQSDLDNSSFSVSGRVFADTVVDPISNSSSVSTAYAKSVFEASYRVNEPMDFSFNGSISGLGDLNFTVGVEDLDSGVILHLFEPSNFDESGKTYDFATGWELEPGNYNFFLSLDTDSEAKTIGYYDEGGLAEYSLDFLAQPRTPEEVNIVYYGVISGSSSMVDSSNGEHFASTPDSSETSSIVPEPGTTALLLLGLASIAGLRRRR